VLSRGVACLVPILVYTLVRKSRVLFTATTCPAGEPTFFFYSKKESSKEKCRPCPKCSAGAGVSSTLLTHRYGLLGGAGFFAASLLPLSLVSVAASDFGLSLFPSFLWQKKALPIFIGTGIMG
jgi:hypothetical protein